jgi:hypothetical protein
VKLGLENRNQKIAAAALGVCLVLLVGYEFRSFSSAVASAPVPATSMTPDPIGATTEAARPASPRSSSSKPGKKERPAPSLDPTLHLVQLASTEQIKYEGSGRNIFVSQPDPVIPVMAGPGVTGPGKKDDKPWVPPAVAAPPPIPLKFFGFASQPGERKEIFLSKGEDVFIAGEGEIVDRRYKVVKISPTSVEIQDVVGSGPPQSIPLTQGSPS